MQEIEAKEQNLEKIFSNDYCFEIPEYQRPYAWTNEQTADLLEDLWIAIDEYAEKRDMNKINQVPPYFLGSIVLIKNTEDKLTKVIDGQQRLTTLTILFCVLRELADEDERHDTKATHELNELVCQEGRRFVGREDSFRLSLRDSDGAFFRENVQTKGKLFEFLKKDKNDKRVCSNDSQKRIHENASYLKQKLSNIEQVKRDFLTSFLLLRCYLVVVSASNQDSAYRIFSVMNDRGLNLSPTDILKAYIIGAISEDKRKVYAKLWEAEEADLGRENFNNLFAHIRMIHTKRKARHNIVKEFRDEVLKGCNGKDFIDDVLIPLAEVYEIVRTATYESTEDAEKVNSYLRHLGRIKNADWVPPTVKFFSRHRNDTKKLIDFTRDLERLAYSLSILRANINVRINRYASVLEEIEQGADLFAEAGHLQLTDEEKSKVVDVLDGPIYLHEKVCLPLLLRLDSLLADEGATYEHKIISIEHVLPQTPASDSTWQRWFPDEEQRNHWVHKLANLVLLSQKKNRQAQNHDFEKKKKEYFEKGNAANFALTNELRDEQEWTVEILERRQRKLLAALKKEWRLEQTVRHQT